ncbi:MAG: TonB-dependent receptor [Myxococcales bacterium]|nr:TonB-dependent receptor [Myxococcales bacterium]
MKQGNARVTLILSLVLAMLGAASHAEAQPAAAGGFTVKGRVVDVATDLPVPEAIISVLDDSGIFVLSDERGEFELVLPAGLHEIAVSSPFHDAVTLSFVAGKNAPTLWAKLTPVAEVDTVEIIGEIDRRSEASQLAVRREATNMVDIVSAQEIARTPDANAGDAVKRVVSATILDGKYVVLRGLEGRYVSTLINGVSVPSPEPERNAVPLDLFPSSLLASLTVAKTYDPAMNGNFGGGMLTLQTNAYPLTPEFKASIGTSYNSIATWESAASHPRDGIAVDLGFFGKRGVPKELATNSPLRPAQGAQVAGAFDDSWEAQPSTLAPNFSLGLTGGTTWRGVGGGKHPIGMLASASFRDNNSLKASETAKVALGSDGLRRTDTIDTTLAANEKTLGALLSTGIRLSPRDDLRLLALYSHAGETTAFSGQGYSESESSNVELARLGMIERSMSLWQLAGDHRLGGGSAGDDAAARPWHLAWQASVATAARNEHDSRDTLYVYDAITGESRFQSQPGSGQRYFSDLADLNVGGGLDLNKQWQAFQLKVGAAVSRYGRTYDGRRFRYRFVGEDPTVLTDSPDTLLISQRVGDELRLQEDTLQEDAYDASLLTTAAYATGELAVTRKLRLQGGARVELASQALGSGSDYAVAGIATDTSRRDADVMPAFNATYVLGEHSSVRSGYSYTLVRPRFRELAPFLYFDYTRRRSISGNTELQNTHIHNADVRWEWFPADSEVIAASGFYKRFVDPIEQVLVNSEADATFRNATGADLLGLEVEGRMSLARIAPALADFYVGANATFGWSQIELDETAAINTSQSRPLYGQSPYAVNASVQYRGARVGDITLAYNVAGRRIVDVGVDGLPDTYEMPLHRVDATYARKVAAQWKLKISATNLLGDTVLLQQGDLAVNQQRLGTTISASLEWIPLP